MDKFEIYYYFKDNPLVKHHFTLEACGFIEASILAETTKPIGSSLKEVKELNG